MGRMLMEEQRNNFHLQVAGCILILWNPEKVDIQILDAAPQVIHCYARCKVTSFAFHVSFVYAFNSVISRRELWSNLVSFGDHCNGPWLALGDFNCVQSSEEKLNGLPVTSYETKDFQECCLSVGLSDMASIGCFYTWSNNSPNSRRSHSFKFFNMWAQHEQFIPTVREAWEQQWPGTHQFKLCKKLKGLKGPLKGLNKKHFSHISERASEQAKCSYINFSDRSSKFFHDIVKRNSRKNYIAAVIKEDGEVTKSNDELAGEFLRFYQDLLGSVGSCEPVDFNVLRAGPIISDQQAEGLICSISDQDIKDALFSIGEDKSPGPDGFSSCFFKKAWHIVGPQICLAVREFFASKSLLKQINHTTIALVPKSSHSSSVEDFRPISCCNVVYKIISKILASRMASILDSIVDHAQAAFVKGRSLGDNVHLVQELLTLWIGVLLSKSWKDDLILMARGDPFSASILMDYLKDFGCKSGLKANVLKSNVFTAGLQGHDLDSILHLSSFSNGRMPFRYLGIPLAVEKLRVSYYDSLIDKIANKISAWTASSLSYAGRAELIKAVLQGTECFWLSILHVPNAVIEKVCRMCRHFLWNSKLYLVSWREDSLWVKWVNHEYFNVHSIWDRQEKKDDSPLLKKLQHIRDLLKLKMGSVPTAVELLSKWASEGSMYVSKAYDFFRSKGKKVRWAEDVWASCIIPKHAFLLWLCVKGKIQTKVNLQFLNIDRTYVLCGSQEESTHHLFFQCSMSSSVWGHIKAWLGISRDMTTIGSTLKWIKREARGASWQGKAKRIALAAMIYHIWQAWNRKVFEDLRACGDNIINRIKTLVYRIMFCMYPYVLIQYEAIAMGQ
ncbi:uncharacterized protein LOC127805524 [Diospyros lotus]|uniref:uncharacterized protein LOC127805524 n=1 Tax=Diospyros lotus TaxID=55363 RepID=UPI00225935ED|nr:uncharacterized protein LOC127805524 [Diospyros lotus]